MIAMSERLIRSILVGDDPELLVSELQNQFPRAAIESDTHSDCELVTQVLEWIERPDQAMQLPVDIRGADFPMRVWDALHNVPDGTTVSYTFLAEQIGVSRSRVRPIPRLPAPPQIASACCRESCGR